MDFAIAMETSKMDAASVVEAVLLDAPTRQPATTMPPPHVTTIRAPTLEGASAIAMGMSWMNVESAGVQAQCLGTPTATAMAWAFATT
jgi:hypothetical protein